MAMVSLAAALATVLSADLSSYSDPGQAALELTTVTGYGACSDQPGEITDSGDYMAVVYYELGDHWYPFTVVFQMSGPQGSLGEVRVYSPLVATDHVTLNDLVADGRWSDQRPAG